MKRKTSTKPKAPEIFMKITDRCELRELNAPQERVVPSFLASFPGSGTKLQTELIEAITGITTSDDAFSNGQHNVIAVQTYFPCASGRVFPGAEKIFKSVIFIRHPMETIAAYFDTLLADENNSSVDTPRPVSLEQWINWRDSSFARELETWKKHFTYWMDRYSSSNRLVVPFHQLMSRKYGPDLTLQIAEFLRRDNNPMLAPDPEDIPCIWQKIVTKEQSRGNHGLRRRLQQDIKFSNLSRSEKQQQSVSTSLPRQQQRQQGNSIPKVQRQQQGVGMTLLQVQQQQHQQGAKMPQLRQQEEGTIQSIQTQQQRSRVQHQNQVVTTPPQQLKRYPQISQRDSGSTERTQEQNDNQIGLAKRVSNEGEVHNSPRRPVATLNKDELYSPDILTNPQARYLIDQPKDHAVNRSEASFLKEFSDVASAVDNEPTTANNELKGTVQPDVKPANNEVELPSEDVKENYRPYTVQQQKEVVMVLTLLLEVYRDDLVLAPVLVEYVDQLTNEFIE